MRTKVKKGRKSGSRNRGYFFRAGRGWTAFDPASKSTATLRGPTGERLTDRRDKQLAADAYTRWKSERAQTPNVRR